MKENKNEIIVMEKVDELRNKLVNKRSDDANVYPLQATLRKELKELKNVKIGHLNTRLSHIKKLKYTEFCELHNDVIQKEKEATEKIKLSLLKEHTEAMEEISNILAKLGDKIDEVKNVGINISSANNLNSFIKRAKGTYNDWGAESINEYFKMDVNFSEKQFIDNVLKEKFNDMYGEAFKQSSDKISKVEETFDEAVLFGDLEMVKDLYMMLKQADAFLDQVAKLEVKA